MMPNAAIFKTFGTIFHPTTQWTWEGTHYQRTAEAWLKNLDSQRTEATEILQSVYGHAEGRRWLHRWRMFFLAVAELFGYANGHEWQVTHCLLEPVLCRSHSRVAL
jgi:cyclopropane-fatty-acyl-phospholipid synthase